MKRNAPDPRQPKIDAIFSVTSKRTTVRSKSLSRNLVALESNNKADQNLGGSLVKIHSKKPEPKQEIDVEGVTILFPGNLVPYDTQLEAMAAMIRGFKAGEDVMVNSPTGTGKTFVGLAAAGSYMLHSQKQASENTETDGTEGNEAKDKKKIRGVIFTAKTHSQLMQSANEWPKLGIPGKVTKLGSREHYCNNPKVNVLQDKTKGCHDILATKEGCPMKKRVDAILDPSVLRKQLNTNIDEALDIEDTCKKLDVMGLCIYFTWNLLLARYADITFAPYSYIFDPRLRNKSIAIHIKDSILLIDEAHNIADVCQSAASFRFDTNAVGRLLSNIRRILKSEKSKEVTHLVEGLEDEELIEICEGKLGKICEKFICCLGYLKALKNFWKELEAKIPKTIQTYTFHWKYTEERLQDHGLYLEGEELAELERTVEFFKRPFTSQKDADSNTKVEEILKRFKPPEDLVSTLENLIFFLRFFTDPENTKFYKCNLEYVEAEPENGTNDIRYFGHPMRPGWILIVSFWCMSPKPAYTYATKDAHSVVLLSGTLNPMSLLGNHLGGNFKELFTGKQVAPPENYMVRIITTDSKGNDFDCTYKNMNNNPEFYVELLKFFCLVCSVTPKGVLVFLGSYRIQKELKRIMENEGILLHEELKQYKSIYFEESNAKQNKVMLDGYERDNLHTEKGAVLFAVYRGPSGEGKNFGGDLGNAIILCGQGLPNPDDEWVKQVSLDLDVNYKKTGGISGRQWQSLAGSNAVQQAAGRGVRGKLDRCTMFCLGKGFAASIIPSHPGYIYWTPWLVVNAKVYKTFKEMEEECSRFWREKLQKK